MVPDENMLRDAEEMVRGVDDDAAHTKKGGGVMTMQPYYRGQQTVPGYMYESLLDEVSAKNVEIACLRNVADVARRTLGRSGFGILYQNDRDALRSALAVLDGIVKK